MRAYRTACHSHLKKNLSAYEDLLKTRSITANAGFSPVKANIACSANNRPRAQDAKLTLLTAPCLTLFRKVCQQVAGVTEGVFDHEVEPQRVHQLVLGFQQTILVPGVLLKTRAREDMMRDSAQNDASSSMVFLVIKAMHSTEKRRNEPIERQAFLAITLANAKHGPCPN